MHSHNKEQFALETYTNNLLYFEKSQKKVYEKLASFEMAIEQNHYTCRYDLVLKEDYFDVLELSTKSYLYATNSYDYAKLVAKSIDFEKCNNAFATFREVKINEKDLQKYANMDIRENSLSGVATTLYYMQSHIAKDASLKKIEKFIFFGVGLGEHLVEIDKKINAALYLIVEDDLELFKLSLFTTPYYKLAKTSELVFSIFESKSEFLSSAEYFLEQKFYYNHYIKYFHMLSHSEEKLEEFHIATASQSHNLFFYSTILEQYLRPLEYLKENFAFLNMLCSYSVLAQNPVLLVAAGPSLEKNLPWLKENQNKFIIIALSATAHLLEKNSITASIVVSMDGFDEAAFHFNKLNSLDFFKETLFFLSARTKKEIVSMLEKKNILFFENGTSYKSAMGNLSAPCVGSTSYLLLLALGVQNLYLLGLDLALDSQSGGTHSGNHCDARTLDLSAPRVHQDTITYRNHIIKVTGNLQESVSTLPEWRSSIESINEVSTHFKSPTQSVYNLSDGAAFSNTLSLDLHTFDAKNLKSIDKQRVHKELLKLFKKRSSSSLTKEEQLLLEQRLHYAKELRHLFLKQQERSFERADDFLASLIALMSQSNTSASGYDLSLIYHEYFRFISSFIFDFFNSLADADATQHVKQINALLSIELLRIADVYINALHSICAKA